MERNAVIRISNLRLRTFVGFNPEEREKRQDVVINVEIHYPINGAVRRDCVSEALDYKTITKTVIDRVENGEFLLLEKLASDVLDWCSQDKRIAYTRVTVDKPYALRFADSVSITLDTGGTPDE